MFEIGKKIKTFRQMKGWSQAEIAEMLRISVPAFSKIETGSTDINLSRLIDIANVFGVSLSEMVSNNPSNEVNNQSELTVAKETIDAQNIKIAYLQEYIITLYERLHRTKLSITDTKLD